jgi:hypothetical protein
MKRLFWSRGASRPALRAVFVAIAAFAATATAVVLVACDAERQQECGKLQAALKPLGDAPSAEAVKRAQDAIAAIAFQDEPLREYAKGATATMTVLANTMELQADPSAPDGTNDVVKAKLKDLAGEQAEVTRYCSP